MMMIEIDSILGSRCVSLSKKDMICMSGALVLSTSESVFANFVIVQYLDAGGENV